MLWIMFVLGAVLSWGMYGPALHKGQVQLGSPLRALLCVGIAYFLIGVLVPVITLWLQGDLKGFTPGGSLTATAAGALGALGAVCIIWSFRTGGLPAYVMPLVFGGQHPPKASPNPLLYVGFVLAALGAGMVLYYKPQ
ncbi:MAG: hypothetical protein DMG05_29545 [Acidobacteria bacterium]|nr:MAG: hypothetical protein DMG05_29545 [Acidobacteriota bacterium]